MLVWFYSTIELRQNEDGSCDYDTYTCSRLFSSLNACSDAALEEEFAEADRNLDRYRDSLERHTQKLEAIELLKSRGINPESLYWNVSPEYPVMQEPQKRFIYSLEVVE